MSKQEALALLQRAEDRIARIKRLSPSEVDYLLEFWRGKKAEAIRVIAAR